MAESIDSVVDSFSIALKKTTNKMIVRCGNFPQTFPEVKKKE